MSARLDRWVDLAINEFKANEVIFHNEQSMKMPVYNCVFKVNVATLPLKRLDLHRVTLCPEMIERLSSIVLLCILGKLRVLGFRKLLDFVLWFQYHPSRLELEIDVPSLWFLEYYSDCYGEIEADGCGSLKDLQLHGVVLRSQLLFLW